MGRWGLGRNEGRRPDAYRTEPEGQRRLTTEAAAQGPPSIHLSCAAPIAGLFRAPLFRVPSCRFCAGGPSRAAPCLGGSVSAPGIFF